MSRPSQIPVSIRIAPVIGTLFSASGDLYPDLETLLDNFIGVPGRITGFFGLAIGIMPSMQNFEAQLASQTERHSEHAMTPCSALLPAISGVEMLLSQSILIVFLQF
jgi:ABC-type phosphate transport system permease subunit